MTDYATSRDAIIEIKWDKTFLLMRHSAAMRKKKKGGSLWYPGRAGILDSASRIPRAKASSGHSREVVLRKHRDRKTTSGNGENRSSRRLTPDPRKENATTLKDPAQWEGGNSRDRTKWGEGGRVNSEGLSVEGRKVTHQLVPKIRTVTVSFRVGVGGGGVGGGGGGGGGGEGVGGGGDRGALTEGNQGKHVQGSLALGGKLKLKGKGGVTRQWARA